MIFFVTFWYFLLPSNYYSGSWIAHFLCCFCLTSEGFLRKRQNYLTSLSGLKLKHLPILFAEVTRHAEVVGIIIDSADVHHWEIGDEILPKHIENSVIFLLES